MLTESHIDEMTPNPPRIPEFYTLTKIHKPTLVGRPIISENPPLMCKHITNGQRPFNTQIFIRAIDQALRKDS